MAKNLHGFELEVEEGHGTLFLVGDLGIAHCGEVKQALVEALAECEELTLDMAGVKDADMTVLQLICSAHRNPEDGAGHIVAVVNHSTAFHDTLVRTGFENYPPSRCNLEQCLYCP